MDSDWLNNVLLSRTNEVLFWFSLVMKLFERLIKEQNQMAKSSLDSSFFLNAEKKALVTAD